MYSNSAQEHFFLHAIEETPKLAPLYTEDRGVTNRHATTITIDSVQSAAISCVFVYRSRRRGARPAGIVRFVCSANHARSHYCRWSRRLLAICDNPFILPDIGSSVSVCSADV